MKLVLEIDCSNPFPSFIQLKKFIQENCRVTICEIRDKFSQRGLSVITMKKHNCFGKEDRLVLAYDINRKFFKYLQLFMKEPYVNCEIDHIDVILDTTIYDGPKQYELLPIVLSIKYSRLYQK